MGEVDVADRDAEHMLHEFRSSASNDVTMSLLRSSGALLYLALMAAHLGDGQVLDGETLTAKIDEDLPRLLRSYPHSEDGALIPFPDADTLLTRWTKKGWVHRTVDPDTRMERYQLTIGASQAVQQMRNLRRRSSIATESALSMVMAEIRQIATEANPDVEARRTAINEQIALLTAQRDALDQGETPEINHRELIDKVSALVQLVERIPADIARYGEQMQANTTALIRQSFADDPAEFAESLQRMFDGHDVISVSPEGLAFRAFATLIATPSERTQLQSDITDILRHVEDLPADLSEALAGFIDAMWNRVRDVEDARGVAFRRMHTFVRGGDALYYRSMRTRISEAQAAATEAFQRTHGGRDIGFTVPMSGVETASVGRLRLDEGLLDTPDPLSTDPDSPIDISALLGRESIDWAALRAAVNTALDQHNGYCTLDEVLDLLEEPRAGDVIGLWSLATQHGQLDANARTTVTVHTSRGLRAIKLPFLLFGEPIPDPVPASISTRLPRSLHTQNVLLEGLDA